MKIDYEKVWIAGGYNKNNANYYNNTIQAVRDRAVDKGLSEEVAATIIHEVLMECANGRKYSIDKCPCGCGIDRSGTAITHEMFARLDVIADKRKDEDAQMFNDRINGLVQMYEQKRANTAPKRVWRFLNKPLGKKQEK